MFAIDLRVYRLDGAAADFLAWLKSPAVAAHWQGYAYLVSAR